MVTETNEAAERLRHYLVPRNDDLVDAALAAERRATVERIRAAVYKTDPTFQVTAGELSAILDEEAAA